MIHRFAERDKANKLSQEGMMRAFRGFVMTEKSLSLGELSRYVLKVELWANKFQIRDMVETLFDVRVKSVRTLIMKGKEKRFRGRKGVTSDFKKAIVTLEPGQSLEGGLLNGKVAV